MLNKDQRKLITRKIEAMEGSVKHLLAIDMKTSANEIRAEADALQSCLDQADRADELQKTIDEYARMCGLTPDADPCKTVRGMAFVLIDRKVQDKDRRVLDVMRGSNKKDNQ